MIACLETPTVMLPWMSLMTGENAPEPTELIRLVSSSVCCESDDAVDGAVIRTEHANDTVTSFEECDSVDAIVGDWHIVKRLGKGSIR